MFPANTKTARMPQERIPFLFVNLFPSFGYGVRVNSTITSKSPNP